MFIRGAHEMVPPLSPAASMTQPGGDIVDMHDSGPVMLAKGRSRRAWLHL